VERWSEVIDMEEAEKQCPEGQTCCRCWGSQWESENGVWTTDRVIRAKGHPVERVQFCLEPVAWRESIWQCVRVHSVKHLGYERVCGTLRRRVAWPGTTEDMRRMYRACVTCRQNKAGAGGERSLMKHDDAGIS